MGLFPERFMFEDIFSYVCRFHICLFGVAFLSVWSYFLGRERLKPGGCQEVEVCCGVQKFQHERLRTSRNKRCDGRS